MDHAFFSAVRLYRELVTVRPAEKLSAALIDALTAYKLEAIEAMKAVRDQLEAER